MTIYHLARVEEWRGEGELFPHVYGPIPAGSVTRVIPAWFEDDAGFATAG